MLDYVFVMLYYAYIEWENEMFWKIGDVAICITPNSRMYGLEVIILSELTYGSIGGQSDAATPLHEASYYYVDAGITDSDALAWAAEPQNLKPLPPPNEVTTWESMEDIFIPKEVVLI